MGICDIEKKREKNESRRAEEFVSISHRAILPNLDQQLQGESLTNATFTCDIKGVYFFSYHISGRSNVSPKSWF